MQDTAYSDLSSKTPGRHRWLQWCNVLLLLGVLILALLFWKPLGENTVKVDFGESSLFLAAPDGSLATEIPYKEVASAELELLRDYGTKQSGAEDGSCLFGVYSNSKWPRYNLYVNTNVAYCLVVTQQDGTVTVANFGNESTTKSTVTAFQQLVAQEQASL